MGLKILLTQTYLVSGTKSFLEIHYFVFRERSWCSSLNNSAKDRQPMISSYLDYGIDIQGCVLLKFSSNVVCYRRLGAQNFYGTCYF